MARRDMARALAAFPEARAVADPFLAQWAAGQRAFSLDGLEAEIVLGDARDTLPLWTGPRRCLVPRRLFAREEPRTVVGCPAWPRSPRHTAPGGTFATYTAAGHVRRALDRRPVSQSSAAPASGTSAT